MDDARDRGGPASDAAVNCYKMTARPVQVNASDFFAFGALDSLGTDEREATYSAGVQKGAQVMSERVVQVDGEAVKGQTKE